MRKPILTNHIDAIIPSKESTWHNTVFITFDIDWANDFIIQDVHELCIEAGVKTTFFVTHKSDYLATLQKDENVSLGIHPNFLPLLKKDINAPSIEKELQRLVSICPGAKAVRSHGVVQGGFLLKEFSNIGCTFDSNDMIPLEANILVKPYKTVFGIVKTPFIWSDEHEWVFERETKFSSIISRHPHDALFIVDFHPIHVFLNTESAVRYERTRPLHQNPNELIKHRYAGYGTRNRLMELLELCRKT